MSLSAIIRVYIGCGGAGDWRHGNDSHVPARLQVDIYPILYLFYCHLQNINF